MPRRTPRRHHHQVNTMLLRALILTIPLVALTYIRGIEFAVGLIFCAAIAWIIFKLTTRRNAKIHEQP